MYVGGREENSAVLGVVGMNAGHERKLVAGEPSELLVGARTTSTGMNPCSRRAWVRSLGATFGGALLVACGGEAAPAAPAAKAEPTKALAVAPTAASVATSAPAPTAVPKAKGPGVEVNFNTWYEAVIPPTQPLFKQFEEEFNVKLTVDLSASNRDTAKYTAWYASGTAPDVVCGDNFIWSKFYNANAILEISDYLKRDKIDLKKDYVLMGSEIWCGKTYAFPFDADPRAVYYNKTLLKQAGAKDPWDDLKGEWTLDDMEEAMYKAARVTGNAGTDVYGVRTDAWGMSESNGMFVWTFGGTWADFDAMKYTLDSKASLDAHDFIKGWYDRKYVMPSAVQTELGGGEKAFGQGRAVFRIRAAAAHSQIRKEIGGNFEYDIAPFPGRVKGQPGVTIVSGNPHTVSKTTKVPDQAYDLIRWLGGPVVQNHWAKEKIQLPTLKSAQAEYVRDPKLHTQVFADSYKVPYGIHFRHDNTRRHYDEYVKEMNEVFAGAKTMADTLKSFTARINNEVEYGSCLPYKGSVVPIKP
jgi:multiple sugar transport system substrate-binding protein